MGTETASAIYWQTVVELLWCMAWLAFTLSCIGIIAGTLRDPFIVPRVFWKLGAEIMTAARKYGARIAPRR